MNTPPFLRRIARTHPWAVRGLLLGLVAWVVTCFALGYRLPWFDRHPDWGHFPTLTNPRLAVEEIPDSTFAACYNHRFSLPDDDRISYPYRANLKNVSSLGVQVTDNRFNFGLYIRLIPGPNDPGNEQGSPNSWRPRFWVTGYEYLELTLGGEKGNFKSLGYYGHTQLTQIYQYNYPTHQQDTLFLRCWGKDYRVYVR